MATKTSVLAAMSGGVDSSVAAGLLHQQGYNVTGVFMCLGQVHKTDSTHPGCCSPQDAADARLVADRLGVPFYVLNFQKDLNQIIDYFVDEYRNARTPNPCIICNSKLKFGKLIEYADMIGAQYVATGHYARTLDVDGERQLHRGLDNHKDQSYALYGVGPEKLDRVMFPLGQYTKAQVREFARQMNLPVHDKGESQEICFVPDDDYAGLISQYAPELCKTGDVVDSVGNVLGQHQGVFRFTIGQRRGLGIALGKPAYVIKLDAETNTVTLGSKAELMQKHLTARDMTWLIDVPDEPFDAVVQIRYNHRGAPATVTPIWQAGKYTDKITAQFHQPVSAVTPGQAAVIYLDQRLIAGGWIV